MVQLKAFDLTLEIGHVPGCIESLTTLGSNCKLQTTQCEDGLVNLYGKAVWEIRSRDGQLLSHPPLQMGLTPNHLVIYLPVGFKSQLWGDAFEGEWAGRRKSWNEVSIQNFYTWRRSNGRTNPCIDAMYLFLF